MSDISKPDKNMSAVIAPCEPDPLADSAECLFERPRDSCSIVILGATGDLTARKLMPALFNLYQHGGLPKPFAVVGCGRTRLDTRRFREKMKAEVDRAFHPGPDRWEAFAANLYYQPLSFDDPASFENLSRYLTELDYTHSLAGNRIFYFALPPSLYKQAAQLLGRAGLGREHLDNLGWSRLVVEKPFGRDLQSATDLDRGIHQYFGEHQIFRIDHYLAKETVQNILMFRFANAIFEPIWNRRYIDHVSIVAAETLGIENRADYYEQAGVLRDMFQNHMMQLLALIAMEPPSAFDAERVRDEKTKTHRCLRPFPVDRLSDYLVLGQYGPGMQDGATMPAYRDEPGVRPDSMMPTFAMMKLFIDNWRWQGVPFFLTSGKRLSRKLTRISIRFKDVPHSMFRRTLGGTITANQLVLGIFPDEKIVLTFQTKTPGVKVKLRPVTMNFNYYQDQAGPTLDAYEKVLQDCMLGDQMLFWRQDGVEACWSFLTPILEGCEICRDRTEMLHTYATGTWGPPAGGKLGPGILPP
ncbi:MAG: glucose-6-phosphate dehydrogenase [Thermodesulfobacteriota bacterium]